MPLTSNVRPHKMLKLLRSAFGDASPEARVSAAKAVLRSANAPLAEQAAAIELLGTEQDEDSKKLVLSFARDQHSHDWLQQVAGESLACMLISEVLSPGELAGVSPAAAAAAIAYLEATAEANGLAALVVLRSMAGE